MDEIVQKPEPEKPELEKIAVSEPLEEVEKCDIKKG
jgi:hypothetical protein